ncbi:hypothetical protein D3C81_1836910 [compost metagenome]
MDFGIGPVAFEYPSGDRLDFGAGWRTFYNRRRRDEVTKPGPAIALPAGICPGPVGKQADNEQPRKGQRRAGAHEPPKKCNGSHHRNDAHLLNLRLHAASRWCAC